MGIRAVDKSRPTKISDNSRSSACRRFLVALDQEAGSNRQLGIKATDATVERFVSAADEHKMR